MVQTRITNNNHLSQFPWARNSPGLSRAVLKKKQPLRQDFLSNQFAKGSQERSGRRGEGKQEQKEGGNQDRVWRQQFRRKLAAPDPLGSSGVLSCPDARGLSTLTPHLSPLVISHPGQQGVNPEACLPLQIQIQCPLQTALNLCFLISKKGNIIHIYLIF